MRACARWWAVVQEVGGAAPGVGRVRGCGAGGATVVGGTGVAVVGFVAMVVMLGHWFGDAELVFWSLARAAALVGVCNQHVVSFASLSDS